VILRNDRQKLVEAIDRFRFELSRGAGTKSIHAAAGPLYESLIRPLQLSEREGAPLVIVPDRILARLPFAALYSRDTGRYLVESRPVTITPSATLLVQSTRRPRHPASSALVTVPSAGGKWRGRVLPTLPQAEREARRVAALYPRGLLLRGSEATRENFVDRSVQHDVIHFAGHAVVDLEAPRRSVLLFDGTSGLEPLSLGDLLDRRAMRASLVVLAGCGTQDSLADDREGLLGLAGAFVAAGAGEVVASTMDVDDAASAQVMSAFHAHYRRNGSAGAAFREAVRDLLRSDSEASSPAAWGSFSVIQGSL
jgi:CHAT domain-containing protein